MPICPKHLLPHVTASNWQRKHSSQASAAQFCMCHNVYWRGQQPSSYLSNDFSLFSLKRGEQRQLTCEKQGEWRCPCHSRERHNLFTHTNSPIQCSLYPTFFNTSATVYPVISLYQFHCLPNNIFVSLSTNAHSPLVGLNYTVSNWHYRYQSPGILCYFHWICIAHRMELFHNI